MNEVEKRQLFLSLGGDNLFPFVMGLDSGELKNLQGSTFLIIDGISPSDENISLLERFIVSSKEFGTVFPPNLIKMINGELKRRAWRTFYISISVANGLRIDIGENDTPGMFWEEHSIERYGYSLKYIVNLLEGISFEYQLLTT